MIVTVILLLAAVVLCAAFVLANRLRRGSHIALPGPRGLPLIGNVFQIDRRRSFETLERWSRIYGDAYRISIFGQPVVVLSSEATIREALVERGRDFAGRPRLFFRAGFMADSHQDIVSGSPGPVWNVLRKTVQREIKWTTKDGGSGRQRLDALSVDILDEMMTDLINSDGQPIDPLPHVYDAVMNMTCLMLIGDRFHRDDEELEMYKRLERLVTTSMTVGGDGVELDMLPWLRFFANPTYRKLCEAKRLRDELYEKIQTRIDSAPNVGTGNDDRRGLCHALLAALHGNDDRKQNSALTPTNVKLAIVNLLIGGASSSTSHIYLLINLLAQNPEAQERLRAEVDSVVGRDRRPSAADRARMPYAVATVMELLRYGSLSPVVIPHQTLRDTFVGDVEIPRGVQVFLHVRRVHHDETFWNEPLRFQPDRFIDRQSGQLVPPEHPNRRRVIAFGGGPRACPGQAVASVRLFLAATSIVQRSLINQDVSTSPATADPRTFEPGLVLTPSKFRVSFHRRD